jgi:fibro-slime domain-containing protein
MIAAIVAACGAAAIVATDAGAQSGGGSVRLGGIVRDFSSSHPDFGVARGGATAGSVSLILGHDSRPVFTGVGQRLVSGARDGDGRPIAAHMATAPASHGVSAFDIGPGSVTPREDFAARVTVLGAAVSTSSYAVPVTLEVRVGDDPFEPFGPFTMALAGNVNTGLEPPSYTSSVTFGASEAISLRTTAWVKHSNSYSGAQENHWTVYRTISSTTDSPRVRVLRNGDPAPAVDGFRSQADAFDFVEPYIDFSNDRMVLEENEAIYLFEFNNDLSSSAADFQDLVVLVELADDPSYFAETTAGAGAGTDTPAVLGSADDGGISSNSSFRQWFHNAPGANSAMLREIELTEAGGVYTFSDANFRPVNGQGFGNEGESENANFTYEVGAYFDYESGGGQWLEVSADGDVWVFVDDELVIDIAGGGSQVIDFDRLNLADGEEAVVRIFHASRSSEDDAFTISTNVLLSTPDAADLPTSAMYD